MRGKTSIVLFEECQVNLTLEMILGEGLMGLFLLGVRDNQQLLVEGIQSNPLHPCSVRQEDTHRLNCLAPTS